MLAKWSFFVFLLLLKTHGHKSPNGLSKCFHCSLKELSEGEVKVWGNALVHSRL